jgi:hypothetical protein
MRDRVYRRMTGTTTRGLLTAFLATVIAVIPMPTVTAQSPAAQPGVERSADCQPRSSRARPSCDPRKSVVARTENEVTFSIELPQLKPVQCASSIEIAYTQADTVVNVDGTIENHDCAASSGDYKVVVSVRDERLDVKRLEFLGSWERQDDQPVKFTSSYPIGENVEVTRVRTVSSHCTCAEASAD